MSDKQNSVPAFPTKVTGEDVEIIIPGMDLRQYAAIHLRVPDSGLEWLDEMILKAKRDEIAAKALAAIIIGNNAGISVMGIGAAKDAYNVAEAFLKQRDEG